MYDALIRYFRSYTSNALLGDEIDLIQRFFSLTKFKKREFFLQEGEVCTYSAFIVKGAMRQYTVSEKGEEHIIKLFIENWWASDYESVLKKTPSIYFIDAWEETDALLVAKTDLMYLINRIPALLEWIRKLDNNFVIDADRRISASIRLSAEERYFDLEKTHPEFIQRFPQHIIASYLGINRETLSRIRSRYVKR
ncbi:MAG TPA: Crp/Fnr family transcriptional regulator [Puia sp.]|nr:Crp/Fnr family transcriptional regulator [Puia sp.]